MTLVSVQGRAAAADITLHRNLNARSLKIWRIYKKRAYVSLKMQLSVKMLKGSYFLLLWWIVGVWMLYASVQVAEGLAKLPLFPCSCGLTGRRKKKEKRGLTTTPLSLHFTAQQKPIPPSPWSERKKRGQRSPPPPLQPPLTNNEENTAGRRGEGGGGGRPGGESEMS